VRICSPGGDEPRPGLFDVVSPDEYEWLCHEYGYFDYSGGGMAAALRKDGRLQYKGLAHCSCYEPMDGWVGPSTISVEEFFKHKNSIHDAFFGPALQARVRELLGLPAVT